MTTHNPNNERIKRRYFAYLKEAKRHSEPTVDAVAKALARFEADTKYRDFKAFHFEQAIAFKKHLAEQRGQRSGEKLSKATLNATLAHLKRFFHWLAGQPGYKSRLQYSDADYFNLSEKDVRIATAKREQVGPTVEQVKHVIALMPADTEIQRRDRALIAFTLLTGARDSAIASMKLKHVDLAAGCVEQDAREVKTKFSKTFTTYFFPVGDEIRRIVDGVGGVSPGGDALGQRRSALSGDAHCGGAVSPIRGGRAGTGSLEQCCANSHDLSRRLRQRRPAVLQPAQLSEHARPARADRLPDPGGVQGVEPEPRTRQGSDDLSELRAGRESASGGDHSRSRQHRNSPCSPMSASLRRRSSVRCAMPEWERWSK